MDFTPVCEAIGAALKCWEPKLAALPDEQIMQRRNRQNRSVKMILGHLVDSAANNHQRMVRLQYQNDLVFPDYQQHNDLWIALQDYQHAGWENLVQLWKFYNLHLVWLICSVNQSALKNRWTNFEGSQVSLQEMIETYLGHLELHLDEIDALLTRGD